MSNRKWIIASEVLFVTATAGIAVFTYMPGREGHWHAVAVGAMCALVRFSGQCR